LGDVYAPGASGRGVVELRRDALRSGDGRRRLDREARRIKLEHLVGARMCDVDGVAGHVEATADGGVWRDPGRARVELGPVDEDALAGELLNAQVRVEDPDVA